MNIHRSAYDGASLSWTVQLVREGSRQVEDGRVVREEPLEIVVNGRSVAVLMRLPGMEKELAVGFCLSEGYLRRMGDVLLIHHCGLGHPAPGDDSLDGPESRNRVELRVVESGFCLPDRPDAVRLIRSGCGAADAAALAGTLPSIESAFSILAPILLACGRTLRDLQPVHREVGGTHSAGLFTATGRSRIVAEDIGRHNAVDKVLGYCALRGISLQDKVLVTSGRASYEMAVKAVRLGVPIVATLSAPTSLAVELAHDRGLTLVGYLRGRRMTVYTHPHRIA